MPAEDELSRLQDTSVKFKVARFFHSVQETHSEFRTIQVTPAQTDPSKLQHHKRKVILQSDYPNLPLQEYHARTTGVTTVAVTFICLRMLAVRRRHKHEQSVHSMFRPQPR